MRNDFYDKVLENPSALGNLDYFLRPLFNREPDKVYNLNKALLYQKPSVRNEDEDTEEMLDFDEDAYLKEQEEKRRQKLKRYESSLGFCWSRHLKKVKFPFLISGKTFRKMRKIQKKCSSN